jgi:putative phosphoesterase
MTRIGLISDTHNYLDTAVFKHFDQCDEIWHAGDFGTKAIADELQAFKPLKGVYGNIDGQDIRSVYPEKLVWTCEEVTVYMKHIGGYPNRYVPGVKQELQQNKAQLFISGHSHILKVIYDDKINCLHMNPGAAGNQGWHQVKTLLRFTIDGKIIKDCEVIELGRRGQTKM